MFQIDSYEVHCIEINRNIWSYQSSSHTRTNKIEQLKNDLKIMRVEVKEQDEEINLLKLNIENKDKI